MQNDEEGQMLYYIEVKLTWKIKRGNGYINNYRDYQIYNKGEDN